MLDPEGKDSLITGYLPFNQLTIPQHIGLAGNYIYYWDDLDNDYQRSQVDATGALDTFVRIKIPEQILSFAQRYGPLGLCKHGRPPMHRGRDQERRWCSPCGNESLKRWLDYVELARSCLNFTATIDVDPNKIKIPAKYFKRIVSNQPKNIPDYKMVSALGFGKWLVVDIINEWLGDAGVWPMLNWDSKEPTLILSGGGIFGALGIQLLSAMTRSNLAVCSGCGMPYIRKLRKPQRGKRNFCPECGETVSNKLRQRDHRKRKNEKEAKP